MTIQMYDLAMAEEARRISPFCWRIRMALHHKELAHECIPVRFGEKDKIAFANTKLVPIIVDDERVVVDSWDIAVYLEAQYPQRPSLFGGEAGAAGAQFVRHWVDRLLQTIVIRIVIFDIYDHCLESDKPYFRENREARFGKTLEEVASDPQGAGKELIRALTPMRETVKLQPFLGGETPNFCDYLVFGTFQWARAVSDKALLPEDHPVYAWRERMLDLYDGLGRKALGYPV